MNHTVTIIILNYNQNKYTLECINSILKSNLKKIVIEIIDNGSNIEFYNELKEGIEKINDERLRFSRIKENRGYVGGINYGLSIAQSRDPEYIMIMNNDTILEENAIFELVKTCKIFNNKAIITGKTLEYDNPQKIQFIGYRYKNMRLLLYENFCLGELDEGQFDVISEMDMIDDIFWLFPNALYKKIGGYSNYFWFNSEQADFALRAKKIGYKLVYTPYAKLRHKGSVSIGGRNNNPALIYWTIQSQLILRYLHLNKINFIMFYFIILLSIVRTYIKSILLFLKNNKNHFQYANAKFKGFIYFNKWILLKMPNVGYNPFLKFP
jgi:GT2 family glycosyltransferase